MLRGLLLLKVLLLLILLKHRMLLAIVLLLCRSFPILVFSEPIRMVVRHPIRILVVPPFAVVPLALLVVGAIFIEPPRVERGPVRMIVIEPAGIVLMPPIGIAPLALAVIVTPLGFGRPLRPVFSVQCLPFVGMVLEVLLQRRVLRAPIGVVEQARIP